MDTNIVKKSVIENYSKLAKSKTNILFSKLFACCDLSKNADEIAKNIGYSIKELEQVPKDANLGVGCGNPSALANIQLGETIIDLGSGAGFDAFIVSKVVGLSGKVIGIDLSDDMLNLARKNAKKGNYNNIEFLKGDIEDLPIDDQIADHIISNCVINLSLNKDKVYKEAFRVLKKGGTIAISDIVLEQDLPGFIKNSFVGHVACISGAEKLNDYLQYVKDAGFKDIKIESKSEFPLELMLTDPHIIKIAQEINFNLNSDQAKDIASRVKSISLSATK